MTLSPELCVTGAHDELCQVRQWLLQPSTDTLEACTPALDRAAGYLHDLAMQIHPGDPNCNLLQPLLALSEEIRTAERLLHSAGVLHYGRLRQITHPDA